MQISGIEVKISSAVSRLGTGIYCANIWSAVRCCSGGPAQLGHGKGPTRNDAIRAARVSFEGRKAAHARGEHSMNDTIMPARSTCGFCYVEGRAS